METIDNLFTRLDILQVDNVPQSFTVQLLDTTNNQIVTFNGSITLYITDARGNQVGTPTISLIDNNTKISIDVKASVPPGYSGTLKYKILYTGANNSFDLWLLAGNINCVDLAHLPADTSDYIPDSGNVIVHSDMGSINNILLELKTGLPGTDGKTVLNGSGAPSNTLGVNGDFYIDNTNKAIYGPKAAGSWGVPTILVGPSGANGKTVHSGMGVPSGSLGVDDDFYLDTNRKEIYGPKTAGAWGNPTSLVGPPGDSHWSKNGDKTYYNIGNVGIGINNPSDKLEVTDTIKIASAGAPTFRTSGNRLTINEASNGPTGETGFVTQFSSAGYGRCVFAITHTGVNTAFFGLNGSTRFTLGAQHGTRISFRQYMSYTANDIGASGFERLAVQGPTGEVEVSIALHIGHPTDTRISRSAPGELNIANKPILTTDNSQTVSNKRISKRVLQRLASAISTLNTNQYDVFDIDVDLDISDLSAWVEGSPQAGDELWFHITASGSNRNINWGTKFEANAQSLLSLATNGYRYFAYFQWNPVTEKWRHVQTL